MSSQDRLRWLMNRELDGELTPVERVELERSVRSSRSAREERAGWRRVRTALAASRPRAQALNTAKIADQIAGELRLRRRVSLPQILMVAAAVAMFWVAVRPADVPVGVAGSEGVRLAQASPPAGPVTVEVDESVFREDPEAVPVEIRF